MPAARCHEHPFQCDRGANLEWNQRGVAEGGWPVLERLRARNEWKFFAVLPKADRALAVVWWVVLVLRGVLPAIFAIAMGILVAAVQHGDGMAGGLALVG